MACRGVLIGVGSSPGAVTSGAFFMRLYRAARCRVAADPVYRMGGASYWVVIALLVRPPPLPPAGPVPPKKGNDPSGYGRRVCPVPPFDGTIRRAGSLWSHGDACPGKCRTPFPTFICWTYPPPAVRRRRVCLITKG